MFYPLFETSHNSVLITTGLLAEVRLSDHEALCQRGRSSEDSIQQLTSVMRQTQNLPPRQGWPVSSLQIPRITTFRGARAEWMFSFPAITDENTA